MAYKCNFTPAEMDLLLKLVVKYKPIIDCKITNTVFNKKKDQAWNNLAREFNISPTVYQRSAKQLRNKYKNWKCTAHKRPNDNRAPAFITEESTQNLSTDTGIKIVSVGGAQALERSNECNGFSEPAMELVEDTSNEENTDTECAASVTNLFTNDTSSETSVTVNDQENSLPSATKKPESNTMTSHKNKLNITAESMDIMTDIAKARKEAIEEENKLFLEFKRTEHMAAMVSLRKDEEYKKLQHQMLVQEHTIKVQLLSAKLEHYQLLNSQIKQNMQAFK